MNQYLLLIIGGLCHIIVNSLYGLGTATEFIDINGYKGLFMHGDYRQANAIKEAAFLQSTIHEEISKKAITAKYKMFFIALIFTTLSFVASHPEKFQQRPLKLLEIGSWILLFISGVLLLAQLNGTWYTPKKIPTSQIKIKLINWINIYLFEKSIAYWLCYLIAMMLIILLKALDI